MHIKGGTPAYQVEEGEAHVCKNNHLHNKKNSETSGLHFPYKLLKDIRRDGVPKKERASTYQAKQGMDSIKQ